MGTGLSSLEQWEQTLQFINLTDLFFDEFGHFLLLSRDNPSIQKYLTAAHEKC